MRYYLIDGHFAGEEGEWPEEATEIAFDEPISDRTVRRHNYRLATRQADRNLFEAVSVDEVTNPGGITDRLTQSRARQRLVKKLSEGRQRDIESARDWLVAKWTPTDHACPHCGNQEWEIGTPFTFSTSIGESSPHFTAMCTNCYYTVFINAIRAGLRPEDG